MDRIKDINTTIGINNYLDAYCIVSPDGRIVLNSNSKPIQQINKKPPENLELSRKVPIFAAEM